MSGGSLERLVYMANQIAREFGAQHPGEAAQATYDHLWHFWDPRMRQMIIEHLDAGGIGLSDDARDAIAMLERSSAEPRSLTKATEFNKAHDQDADRDLMSDAG